MRSRKKLKQLFIIKETWAQHMSDVAARNIIPRGEFGEKLISISLECLPTTKSTPLHSVQADK